MLCFLIAHISAKACVTMHLLLPPSQQTLAGLDPPMTGTSWKMSSVSAWMSGKSPSKSSPEAAKPEVEEEELLDDLDDTDDKEVEDDEEVSDLNCQN